MFKNSVPNGAVTPGSAITLSSLQKMQDEMNQVLKKSFAQAVRPIILPHVIAAICRGELTQEQGRKMLEGLDGFRLLSSDTKLACSPKTFAILRSIVDYKSGPKPFGEGEEYAGIHGVKIYVSQWVPDGELIPFSTVDLKEPSWQTLDPAQ